MKVARAVLPVARWLLALAVLLLPRASAAADPPWRFTLSPGLWGAGVNGRARMGGVDVDFLRSLVTVTEGRSLGVTAGFEVGRGPLGFRVDAAWGSSEFAARGSRPLVAALLDGHVDLEIRLVQALGSYRVGEWGPAGGRHARLELFGGVRYGRITAGFEQRAVVFDLRVARDFDWLDPVAGAAAAVDLGGGWRFAARGDAAWLAVLDDAGRASWSAEAFLLWNVKPDFDIRAGWRHLVAYAPSGLRDDLEVTLSGPEAGIGLRF